MCGKQWGRLECGQRAWRRDFLNMMEPAFSVREIRKSENYGEWIAACHGSNKGDKHLVQLKKDSHNSAKEIWT